MQNLYNELTSSITEYLEGGTVNNRPPTSLMLRAARTLKTLSDTNDTNLVNINSLQVIAMNDHEMISQLHEQNREQAKEIDQLRTQQKSLYAQLLTKEANESLRENSGQQEPQSNSVGCLGDGGGVDFGGDSRSEEGIQSEDCGLGTN